MKRGACVIGLDIGTSAVKGVLCAADGTVTASHALPIESRCTPEGRMEQDPVLSWWTPCAELTRTLLAGNASADDVAGVGVCGAFPSLVALDEEGDPLAPGILYLDGRGAREMEAAFPGRTREPPCFLSAKLAWMRRRQPELLSRTRMILPAPAYVVWRLAGARVVDRTLASDTVLLQGDGAWDPAVCASLGVSPSFLPEIARATRTAGAVTREAAAVTGLREGTPVAVATGDIAAEALSAGVTEPGRGMIVYGSTICCIVCAEGTDAAGSGLGVCPHAVPGLSLIVGGTATSGSALDWLVSSIFNEQIPGAYERLNGLAQSIPPGAGGLLVLPDLMGSRAPLRDPDARGVVSGLALSTRREHVYRAFLEGIAFTVRQILEAMAPLTALPDLFSATGSGFSNTLLRQIIADATGREQQGLRHSSAARGAARLAAVSAGMITGADAFGRAWPSEADARVIPDRALDPTYDGLFARYRSLQALRGHEMARLAADGRSTDEVTRT